MLYIRMILILGVSLYTTRMVLNVLGVEDFGIYNVVAGFVSMFAFLNGALSAATSRFLSYELGKKDLNKLQLVFRTSLTIHILLAILVFVGLLIVGFWFLNNKLVVPADRIYAANVVFLFAVISTIIGIVQVPFTALIIAHEKMGIYAFIGIFDVLARLLLVLLLKTSKGDALIMYGLLMLLIVICLFLIYLIYCKRSFKESKMRLIFNKELFNTMLLYSGWSFVGSFANLLKTQGINVLINMFFGPAVNAARGIAYQINMAMGQFAQNFIIASNPQIIKYYAEKDIKSMLTLVMNVARFSFFLMFFFSLPLIFETDFLLSLWLVEIPDYTSVFIKLIIINLLVDAFTFPMGTSIQATGRIKYYQIAIGGVISLNLPFSFLLFKLGYPPEASIIVSIALSFISLFVRVVLIKREIPTLNGISFVKDVFIKSFVVAGLSIIVPYFIHSSMVFGWLRFFVVSISGVLSTALFVFMIGINKAEKQLVISKVRNVINNIR